MHGNMNIEPAKIVQENSTPGYILYPISKRRVNAATVKCDKIVIVTE